MKQSIILDDNDIREALMQYVRNNGVNLEGKETNLTITAGRKGKGYFAEIEINDNMGNDPVTAVVNISDKKTRKPRRTKADITRAAVEKVEDQEESTEETSTGLLDLAEDDDAGELAEEDDEDESEKLTSENKSLFGQ